MKKVLKWIGVVVGALLGIVLLAAVALSLVDGAEWNKTMAIEPETIPIPTDDASLARGAHIVYILCTGCHGQDLTGAPVFDEPSIASVYASNITGLAETWSDADIVRAMLPVVVVTLLFAACAQARPFDGSITANQPTAALQATLASSVVPDEGLVLNLRLPRLVAALLTGVSLAGTGVVLQTVFRNPIVEPGFLGISQGAAFGAALGIIVLRPGPLGIELAATAFALIGLGLSYLLAERLRFGVLAGVFGFSVVLFGSLLGGGLAMSAGSRRV